ncbi:MAG TPA: AraC family transcriptional regulator [Caulobacteraceae bacterium]|jgi:AraC-like DNA-binding protein|nr:AraC family transcriptional regulator [Caulobacteraceae bacterium]
MSSLPEDPPRGPSTRDAALVPGAFLVAYIDAARQAELEPFRQLRRAGLPTEALDAENLFVSHARFLGLLDASARASRQPDFALGVVRAISLASAGPVGVLARSQPTVRDALIVLCRYSGDARRKMRAVLEEVGDVATIRLNCRAGPGDRSSRASEMAVGFALRAIQGLLGEDWRPTTTLFACPSPVNEAPYRQLFGPVVFDQLFDALEFDAADLARPLPTANIGLARLVADYLQRRAPVPATSFPDEVRALIDALLPHGVCSLDVIARRLGVDRRTVHRRLLDAGLSFTDLVQAARQEIVDARLTGGEPIAAIAQAAGFSGPSPFSRWFRLTYGAPPTWFRKQG